MITRLEYRSCYLHHSWLFSSSSYTPWNAYLSYLCSHSHLGWSSFRPDSHRTWQMFIHAAAIALAKLCTIALLLPSLQCRFQTSSMTLMPLVYIPAIRRCLVVCWWPRLLGISLVQPFVHPQPYSRVHVKLQTLSMLETVNEIQQACSREADFSSQGKSSGCSIHILVFS